MEETDFRSYSVAIENSRVLQRNTDISEAHGNLATRGHFPFRRKTKRDRQGSVGKIWTYIPLPCVHLAVYNREKDASVFIAVELFPRLSILPRSPSLA